MKTFPFFFICFALLESASAMGAGSPTIPELVVYAYDSFLAKGGLGPAVIPVFEKKCSCRVKGIAAGDAGQMLTRLELEAARGKPRAHVAIGLDRLTWQRARGIAESWGEWKPRGYDRLVEKAKVASGFLPIDYGILAFMADRQTLTEGKLSPPASLRDLLKPEWKRNFVLEDPRTSAPGLAFLLYTESVLGEGVWDYWKSLRAQWLTLAPGWSAAYQLFSHKEAALVWSYTSSQAYHEERGDLPDPARRRYQALLFKEGHPVQVEGAIWVRGSATTAADRQRIQDFLEFLISEEVQKQVAHSQWMYPVSADVRLPESFMRLPKPETFVELQVTEKKVADALLKWSRAVEGP